MSARRPTLDFGNFASMSVRTRLDDLYARHLRARLLQGPLPRHIGVIIDGNRRWARQMGFEDVREGHRHGARHIARLMEWCEGLGVGHVTVYLASVDNLTKRASPEMAFLMRVIEDVVRDRLTAPGANWRVEAVGRLDMLPSSTAEVLKQAEEDTRGATGPELTLAIGYGSREEIVDASGISCSKGRRTASPSPRSLRRFPSTRFPRICTRRAVRNRT